MQRNPSQDSRHPRKDAERDASQAIGGQPRSGDDDEEAQKPEGIRSHLTARELQARGKRDTPRAPADKLKDADSDEE